MELKLSLIVFDFFQYLVKNVKNYVL